ncbi:MAG: aminotransferase class V-fold PLP-dependent enzyme [Streptosporangiaceae bacterium]
MTFDVNRVRAAYPALSDGFAYLDGAAGTQVPEPVIEAIAEAYRSGIGNVGGTYRLAEALSRRWEPGDEIVVSRLDHDANVRPWVQAAARHGLTVRWAEIDPATTELPAAQFGDLLSERTQLVAVTPPRTSRWTSRRSGPTSTPPAPTSGQARTSAPWSSIRPCSRPSTRTNSRPRRPACRTGSSAAPPPSPTWPGWPPCSAGCSTAWARWGT